MYMYVYMCGCTHDCECVVNGTGAIRASLVVVFFFRVTLLRGVM